MAQKRAATNRRQNKTLKQVQWHFPLVKSNMTWIGISLGVIILGYILLGLSITEDAATLDGSWANTISVDIAPVVLVIGYCILLPYAILKGKKITRDKYSQDQPLTESENNEPVAVSTK